MTLGDDTTADIAGLQFVGGTLRADGGLAGTDATPASFTRTSRLSVLPVRPAEQGRKIGFVLRPPSPARAVSVRCRNRGSVFSRYSNQSSSDSNPISTPMGLP